MLAASVMASTTEEEAAGELAGRVFSKSDVGTMEDRPIQVLVVAVPSARFDSLLQAADGGPEEPTGDIVGMRGSIQEPFTAYATGHDVSGEDGKYRIQVEESGVHYLCLTGETEVPEEDAWTVAGCMRVEVPDSKTVKQDLYMQFNRLVAPPR
jgi:hypothetical protein